MKTYLLKPNVRQAIAKAGETDVAVAYNAKEWIDDYPAGIPQLMVTRPDGVRVPVTVTKEDNLITGQVPNELLVNPGMYSYVFVWTSGATQLESGRCECMVLGSELAKTWADVRKAPDWAERIFLAAGVIESAIPGMMEARNTTADNAAEAKTAAEGAAESESAAADSAEAAAASEENIETILTNMEQTITDATAAMNGIEAQKDTMIASIAAIAEMGTDTTFTQSGVAADAKAVGDLKSTLYQENGLVTKDYECIETIDTGLSGLYLEDGSLDTDTTGFRRFYVPVFPNVNYVLTLDYTRNKYSYLCEFAKDGTLANIIGVVEASNTFKTGNNTYYLGFAAKTNGLVSASLIQKELLSDIYNYADGVESRINYRIDQTQAYSSQNFECINSLNTGLIGLYQSDGTLVSDNGWTRFYIQVIPLTKYSLKLSFNYSGLSYLCEFNDQGTFLRNLGNVIDTEFVTSENAAYIGFGCSTQSLTGASLVQQYDKSLTALSKNKIRISPYIVGAITNNGSFANYGDAYIISTLSYLVEPRITLKVVPEAGYNCYIAWYTPDGTFIERTKNFSAEQIIKIYEPRLMRFGIFKEGETLDVTATDLYANVFRYDLYNDEYGLCGTDLGSLYLTGDFVTMTKDNATWCDVVGFGLAESPFTARAKIKWQGSSSVQYMKKNFSLTLYESDDTTKKKITVRDSWGALSKYVLKANYIDHTMAKNVCCAKLYASTVPKRVTSGITTELLSTPNNGCVDGFPIKLFINNEYAGLYTFNLAKDEYLFGDSIKIFINAENATDSCKFRDEAIFDDENWQVEFTDTEDITEYEASFNQLSVICLDTTTYPDGSAFKTAISAVLDIPSMIDKMIMIKLCGMSDQYTKNQMFGTYDGTKWFTTMYDMDTCFGFASNGKYAGSTKIDFTFTSTSNLLMNRIMTNYQQEIYTRYNALRQTVLSKRNLTNLFRGFVADIPHTLMNLDEVLYNLPATQNDTVDQICEFLGMSLDELDAIAGD